MAEQENDLTEAQKKEISEVYGYKAEAEFTEKDIEIAKAMFDTPEKFALLRKIFQSFNPEERGLTMKSAKAMIDADPSDLKVYGAQTVINNLVDERIRQYLLNFYLFLKGEFKQNRKDEFLKSNKEKFEKDKRAEETKEEREEDKREVGPNV